MRQGQQNRRGRGRNRKSQNPLTRSFESNGPDVKIRGTPSHIAEKYISLARDALASGDPVLAENYLQHAEHYNRIIMTFREQQAPHGEGINGSGNGRHRMSDQVRGRKKGPAVEAGDDDPARPGTTARHGRAAMRKARRRKRSARSAAQTVRAERHAAAAQQRIQLRVANAAVQQRQKPVMPMTRQNRARALRGDANANRSVTTVTSRNSSSVRFADRASPLAKAAADEPAQAAARRRQRLKLV